MVNSFEIFLVLVNRIQGRLDIFLVTKFIKLTTYLNWKARWDFSAEIIHSIMAQHRSWVKYCPIHIRCLTMMEDDPSSMTNTTEHSLIHIPMSQARVLEPWTYCSIQIQAAKHLCMCVVLWEYCFKFNVLICKMGINVQVGFSYYTWFSFLMSPVSVPEQCTTSGGFEYSFRILPHQLRIIKYSVNNSWTEMNIKSGTFVMIRIFTYQQICAVCLGLEIISHSPRGQNISLSVSSQDALLTMY